MAHLQKDKHLLRMFLDSRLWTWLSLNREKEEIRAELIVGFQETKNFYLPTSQSLFSSSHYGGTVTVQVCRSRQRTQGSQLPHSPGRSSVEWNHTPTLSILLAKRHLYVSPATPDTTSPQTTCSSTSLPQPFSGQVVSMVAVLSWANRCQCFSVCFWAPPLG